MPKKKTNYFLVCLMLIQIKNYNMVVRYTPGPGSNERFDFQPTEAEIREIKELFKDDFEIPFNFEQSALAFKPTGARINMSQVNILIIFQVCIFS